MLLLLGFEGAIVRVQPIGTWVSGAYRYAATDDWLPGGLGELTSPAGGRGADPALVAGLRTGDHRRPALVDGLDADPDPAGSGRRRGPVEVPLGEGTGWLAEDDPGDVAEPEPWIALLPSLDPTAMGWKQRAWYLPETAAEAFDSVGNAGPTIWVDGRVVGAWAQTTDGRLHQHYFERVAASRRREVDDRAGRAAELGRRHPVHRALPRRHPRPVDRLMTCRGPGDVPAETPDVPAGTPETFPRERVTA